MTIKPIRNSKNAFIRAVALKSHWSNESFLSLLVLIYACELMEEIERNTRRRKSSK